MKKILIISLCILCLIACNNNKQTNKESDTKEFANCFSISKHENFHLLKIFNPWDSTKILNTYVIAEENAQIPNTFKGQQIIRTPIESIVVFSSIHCAMIEALGCENLIKGVCDTDYINLESIQKGLKSGEIKNLGNGLSPDIEAIVNLSPDLILSSPIDNSGYGRMGQIGIPIVECIDYMENNILGRTEWLKLFGLLLSKEKEADSIYNSIAAKYNSIKDNIAAQSDSTKQLILLPELRNGSLWYLPGGNSYVAKMYKDAGAKYPWDYTNNTASFSISFEQVMEKAVNADIWIFKYYRPDNIKYSNLHTLNPGCENFKAFKNKKIYASNTANSTYYEDIVLQPHLILKDFALIFNPHIYGDNIKDSLRYFRPLE